MSDSFDVPLEAADFESLRQVVGSLRWVPGFQAWTAQTAGGRVLYVDRRFVQPDQWPEVWRAAFGFPPPHGYPLGPLAATRRRRKHIHFVVIQIIAVLIS